MSSGSEWFHIGNKQKDKALSPSPESQLQSFGIRSPLANPSLGCSKACFFFFCVRGMGLSPRILARRGGWEVTRELHPNPAKSWNRLRLFSLSRSLGLRPVALGSPFGFYMLLLHGGQLSEAPQGPRPLRVSAGAPGGSPLMGSGALAGRLQDRESFVSRKSSYVSR